VIDDPAMRSRSPLLIWEMVKAIPASRDVVDITTYHVGLREHFLMVSTEKKEVFWRWNPAWTAIGITELGIEGLILRFARLCHSIGGLFGSWQVVNRYTTIQVSNSSESRFILG